MKYFFLQFVLVLSSYSASFVSPYDYKSNETIILKPISDSIKSEKIVIPNEIEKENITKDEKELDSNKELSAKDNNQTQNNIVYKSPYDGDYNKSLIKNRVVEEKSFIQSIELKDKIAEEKAIEETKLKEFEKDVYTTKESLKNIESIDSKTIADNKIVEFKKASDEVKTVDLSLEEDKNPKKTNEVEDFFTKVNAPSTDKDSKLLPIVME